MFDLSNNITIIRFLASPQGSRVKWIIFDEGHEFNTPHPEWEASFHGFAIIASCLGIQQIWASGSQPPHLQPTLCMNVFLDKKSLEIRASTIHPELSYQVLPHPWVSASLLPLFIWWLISKENWLNVTILSSFSRTTLWQRHLPRRLIVQFTTVNSPFLVTQRTITSSTGTLATPKSLQQQLPLLKAFIEDTSNM